MKQKFVQQALSDESSDQSYDDEEATSPQSELPLSTPPLPPGKGLSISSRKVPKSDSSETWK
jgi:hypothetical protein